MSKTILLNITRESRVKPIHAIGDKRISKRRGSKSTIDEKTAFECLKSSIILRGIKNKTIKEIVKKGKIIARKKDEMLTKEGERGNSAYFILKGRIGVIIKGIKIAEREANEFVGEMSILDPSRNRCASLKVLEKSDLLMIESDFLRELLDRHSIILKNIAIELCKRLRERSKYYVCPNSIPKVFIGSSSENLNIAKKIFNLLNDYEISRWDLNVFTPSENCIESLISESQNCDFAILILTPDDLVTSREKETMAPRDNVLFELGLFMGAIGKDRTYIISTDPDLKIPSDLAGINRIQCIIKNHRIINKKEIANSIKQEIDNKGVRIRENIKRN